MGRALREIQGEKEIAGMEERLFRAQTKVLREGLGERRDVERESDHACSVHRRGR